MKVHAPWAAVSAAIIAAALAAAAPPLFAQVQQPSVSEFDQSTETAGHVVPIKDARLKIELNATDRDAGIQLFIDADPWKSMAVFDTHGKLMFRATARGRLARNGGTELFLESGEPTLDEVPLHEFLKRYPAGNYRMVGQGLKGEKLVGAAKFTHNVPDGPVLVAPAEDALVDPNNLSVSWQPVAAPNGSPIIGYQVLVVKPDTGVRALPKIILDVMMPPNATSMAVPPGYLLANSTYEWEVLAIESGGNQTLSVGHFRTPR
jgi:hypothetical protein